MADQAYMDQATGEIVVMSDEGDGWTIGSFAEGLGDFIDDPMDTIGEWTGIDPGGDDAAASGSGSGVGAGNLPPLPGQGGGMSGIGTGGGGTITVPQPGSTQPVGTSGVPQQAMQWAIRFFSQYPGALKTIGRKLGLLGGASSHDEMLSKPGCASLMAEHLPPAKRKAVEQWMCGFRQPLGGADEETFLAMMIATSGADPSVCRCG